MGECLGILIHVQITETEIEVVKGELVISKPLLLHESGKYSDCLVILFQFAQYNSLKIENTCLSDWCIKCFHKSSKILFVFGSIFVDMISK